MAVINGAKSLEDVKRTVKSGFVPLIRVSTWQIPSTTSSYRVTWLQVTWVVSPLAMIFAQKFLPVEVKMHVN